MPFWACRSRKKQEARSRFLRKEYIMGSRNISIGRRIGYGLIAFAVSLSLFGCKKKEKTVELTPEKKEFIESLTKSAVYEKAFELYGQQPGVLIKEISATDGSLGDYQRTDFVANGTYTVKDESGETYSGKFKASGYIEAHGSGWHCDELSPAKNGSTPLPTQAPVPTTEATTQETVETSVLTLQSDVMIKLSKQYEKDGLRIRINDPEAEFDGCYGAKEYFQAFNDDHLYSVYLYDTHEAAENAEKMMFGDGASATTTSVDVSARIVEDTVLIAEYSK